MPHARSLPTPRPRSAALLARLALVAVLACLVSLGAVPPAPAHAQALVTGAPSPVYLYSNQAGTSWVSLAHHGVLQDPSDFTGWQQASTPQFAVDLIGNANMVAVYRWQNTTTRGWRDVVQGSPSDDQMTADGYANRTFQWYALPIYWPGSVAVYQWYHPADGEWITLADQEIPDATMGAWGYGSKTFLFYAFPTPGTPGTGYFPLGTPQTEVLARPTWNGSIVYPHTFSVLDVNPGLDSHVNQGYRFLGYFGTTDGNGIGIARSSDLNAASWQEDPGPLLAFGPHDRWASALKDGNMIDVVDNMDYSAPGYGIYGRTSTDGLNGTHFTDPLPLVKESDAQDGNPTLFQDPNTGVVYLYWWRFNSVTQMHEIRVKSASSFAALYATGPTNLGQVVVSSPQRFAAPQVVFVSGQGYYLSVETYENVDVWMTRVLHGPDPLDFTEIPGNPVYGAGSACVFQQVFDNQLHSFYCHQATPGVDSSWTLDHVSAPLTPV